MASNERTIRNTLEDRAIDGGSLLYLRILDGYDEMRGILEPLRPVHDDKLEALDAIFESLVADLDDSDDVVRDAATLMARTTGGVGILATVAAWRADLPDHAVVEVAGGWIPAPELVERAELWLEWRLSHVLDDLVEEAEAQLPLDKIDLRGQTTSITAEETADPDSID